MANEILVKSGTQLLFADHATDFGAAPTTAANSLISGTPTDVQLDLTGVAASGGARESAKFDFGATRAGWYSLSAALEFETAPTDGGRVEFYLGTSPNSTAANGNPAGLTGSDASFTDTTGNLAQLQFLGSIGVRNNVVNIGNTDFLFRPQHRYGMLVVVNFASTGLRNTATAMDETHIVITPLIDEVQ